MGHTATMVTHDSLCDRDSVALIGFGVACLLTVPARDTGRYLNHQPAIVDEPVTQRTPVPASTLNPPHHLIIINPTDQVIHPLRRVRDLDGEHLRPSRINPCSCKSVLVRIDTNGRNVLNR
jgi:hypothetical protein